MNIRKRILFCLLLIASFSRAADIPRNGLLLWFKADGDLKLDGQSVVQWNDMSGNNNHATRVPTTEPSTGAMLVPNAFNGKPVLHFDGSDTTFGFHRVANMRTIFYAVKKDPASFSQPNERFVLGDTGFELLYNTDFHTGSHGKGYILHPNTCADYLREGQIRVNGKLVNGVCTDFPKTLGVISMVATGNCTASRISGDRGYKGRCWQGDIAEIIAYDHVLPDAQRASVEKYLFEKYAIAGKSEPAPPSDAWAAAESDQTVQTPPTDSPRPFMTISLAFSPDGKILASADDAVRLWNPDNGKLIGTLPAKLPDESHPPVKSQPGQFTHLAFSPDSKLVAASATDLAMRIWRTDDAAAIPLQNDLARAGFALWGFVFSPDGQSLLVNSREGNEVRRYAVSTGELAARLTAPQKDGLSRLWWLALSPDGKRLAVSAENHAIRLFDADTGELSAALDPGSVVWCFAFSPDGKTLAAACVNMTLQLWDVQSGKLRQTLTGHSAALTCVAYSPDGKLLATGSDDATVRIWDAETGLPIRTMRADAGGVWSIAFSPDGKTLASGGEDRNIKLWDPQTGNLLRTLSENDGP